MDHSLAVLNVWHGESQLLPEELVTGIDARVCFEVETEVGVEVPRGDLAQDDDDESLSPLLEDLVMGAFELESTPLVLDEVLRQDDYGAPRRLHGFHDRLGDVGGDGEIAIVQTHAIRPISSLQLAG